MLEGAVIQLTVAPLIKSIWHKKIINQIHTTLIHCTMLLWSSWHSNETAHFDPNLMEGYMAHKNFRHLALQYILWIQISKLKTGFAISLFTIKSSHSKHEFSNWELQFFVGLVCWNHVSTHYLAQSLEVKVFISYRDPF